MSAKHTPTPWRVGRPGTVVSDSHIEHGPGGCDCVEYYGGHLIAESITSANASRIAACVNACEGITTERLEDLGRPLMKHLIGCDERAARQVKEAAELCAQRDELLAVLKAAGKWINSAQHGDNCFVSDHYEGDPGNRCNCGKDGFSQYIDAAIAKSEGTGA